MGQTKGLTANWPIDLTALTGVLRTVAGGGAGRKQQVRRSYPGKLAQENWPRKTGPGKLTQANLRGRSHWGKLIGANSLGRPHLSADRSNRSTLASLFYQPGKCNNFIVRWL